MSASQPIEPVALAAELDSKLTIDASSARPKPSFAELARQASSALAPAGGPVGVVVPKAYPASPPAASPVSARRPAPVNEEATGAAPAKEPAVQGEEDRVPATEQDPKSVQDAPLPAVNIWHQRMAEQDAPSRKASGTGLATARLADSENWPTLRRMLLTPPASPQRSAAQESAAGPMPAKPPAGSPASPPLSDVGDDEEATLGASQPRTASVAASNSRKKWKPLAVPLAYESATTSTSAATGHGGSNGRPRPPLATTTTQKTSLPTADVNGASRVPERPGAPAKMGRPRALGPSVAPVAAPAVFGGSGPFSHPHYRRRRFHNAGSGSSSGPAPAHYVGNGRGPQYYMGPNGVPSFAPGAGGAAAHRVPPVAGSFVHSGGADPARQLNLGNAKAWLRYQIEYYFGSDNLCRDMFLRKAMDAEGFVPLRTILAFNRVRYLLQAARPFACKNPSDADEPDGLLDESWVVPLVAASLDSSGVVELLEQPAGLDERIWQVRRRGDWMVWRLQKEPEN